MDTRQWDRLAAATGIVFVIMQFVIPAVMGDRPDFDAGPREIRDYLVDDGGNVLLAAMINAFSAFFFIWFLGSLRAVLRIAEGGQGRLSAVAFGAGLVTITLAVAASIPLVGLAWEDTAELADRGLLRAVWNLNTLAFVPLAATGTAFALSVTILILRTRLFPMWVAVVGGAAAVVQVIGAFALAADDYDTALGFFGFLGFVLTMLFILILSVYMVIRLGGSRATA